jgi:hypothetical protein
MTDELDAKLMAFKDNTKAQLHNLDRHRTEPADATRAQSASASVPTRQRAASAGNVVVTHVAENKNFRPWHSAPNSVLQIASGCNVNIPDALRLERFQSDQTRPILVTQNSVPDKRLTLSNARVSVEHSKYRCSVYIREYKTLDIRRKNT